MAGEEQQLYHPEETIFRLRTEEEEHSQVSAPLTEDALKYRRDEAMQSTHAQKLREWEKKHTFIASKQAETDRFSLTFKPEISESKRKVKKHLAGSAIHAKQKNASRITDAELDAQKEHDKLFEKAREYAKKEGIDTAGPGPQLLKDLSCFFLEGRKNAEGNKKLITGASDPDQAMDVLETVRTRFMEMDIEKFDFRSDESLSKESERLEEVTYKYNAIRRILVSNPDYFNSLSDENRDMLTAKLELTGRIVSYYRAKKALIKDNYYSSHYNSEISRFILDTSDEDELNVTDLIKNVGLAEYLLKNRPSPEAIQQYYSDRAKAMLESGWERMINTHKRINYSDPTESAMGDLAAGSMQFVSWAMRDKRTTDHGESRYDTSVQLLRKLPRQVQNIGATQNGVKWQRGNAPEVDLDKYFTDSHKAELSALLNAAPRVLETDGEYKQACEALQNYLKIRGIVNRDTTEMEMAFLDRFLKAHKRYLSAHPDDTSQEFADRKAFLDTVAGKINALGSGHLGEDMPDGMLDYIRDHAEIISEDTTYTHNEESSNIKDIPLFLHTPNINDIKQSSIGDCWLVSALTSLAATDPEFITSMMKDLGDGTVLIRLYNMEDSKGNQVFDHKKLETNEVTFTPAYYRIRKDYETGEGNAGDCTWVQLVEKAYALAGFNVKHKAKVKDGKMSNVAEELTCGSAQMALSHITGRLMENAATVTDIPASFILQDANETTFLELTAGLPKYIRDVMKSDLGYKGNAIHLETMLASVQAAFMQCNGFFIGKISQIEGAINARSGLTPEQKTEYIERIKKVVSFDATADDYKAIFRANMEAFAKGETVKHSGTETEEFGFDKLSANLIDLYSGITKEGQIRDEQVADFIDAMLHECIIVVEHPEAPLVPARIKDLYGAGITDNVYKQRVDEAVGNARLVALSYKYQNDGRYNLGQMKFLAACRDATLDRKGAVSISIPHYVSVVDTEQKNGTWYLLVKDPFNTYNKVYGDPETEGGPETCEEEAFIDVLKPSKNRVKRELSDDENTSMLGGFRGLSWWKLEDLYPVTSLATPITRTHTRREDQ